MCLKWIGKTSKALWEICLVTNFSGESGSSSFLVPPFVAISHALTTLKMGSFCSFAMVSRASAESFGLSATHHRDA